MTDILSVRTLGFDYIAQTFLYSLIGSSYLIYLQKKLTPIFSFHFTLFTIFSLWILLPRFTNVILYCLSYSPHISHTYLSPSWLSFFQFSFFFISSFILCNLIVPRFLIVSIQDKIVASIHSGSLLLRACYLLASILAVLLFLLISSISIDEWITSFSTTFTEGREGLGIYFLLIGKLSNLLSLLIGQTYVSFRYKRSAFSTTNTRLVFPLLIVLLCSALTGFKSSLILNLILLFMPSNFQARFSFKSFKYLLGLFLILLFGNFVRSNGYYTGMLSLEYLGVYFNTESLHEILLAKNLQSQASLPTSFEMAVTYIHNLYFRLGNVNEARNLSTLLSSVYFPTQWKYVSTQQWPIISELYLSFSHLYLLWPLPTAIYYYTLSRILNSLMRLPSLSNYLFIQYIFVMEMFRLLSVYRSFYYDLNFFIYTVPVYIIVFVLLRFLLLPAKRKFLPFSF